MLNHQVTAAIKLNETAEGSGFETDIINETLYTWDSTNEQFPPQIHFRYTLPSHLTNSVTREWSRLHPSFQSSLTRIPGFKVDVSYRICVHIACSQDGSDWWPKEVDNLSYVCITVLRWCAILQYFTFPFVTSKSLGLPVVYQSISVVSYTEWA